MKEEKKPTSPKFNIYWLYGAIIFVLLGMSLFGGSDSFRRSFYADRLIMKCYIASF